jgi:hypothetical protein
LLKNAQVVSISIYSRQGVVLVRGLKFLVGDEWTWHKGGIEFKKPEVGKKVSLKLILGVCIGVVGAITVVTIALIVNKKRDSGGMDSNPLITRRD